MNNRSLDLLRVGNMTQNIRSLKASELGTCSVLHLSNVPSSGIAGSSSRRHVATDTEMLSMYERICSPPAWPDTKSGSSHKISHHDNV